MSGKNWGLKYPNPDVVDLYLRKSDNDNDPRDLMALLRHTRKVNTRIQGHISVRKTAIAAYDWQVIPLDGDESEAYKNAKLRTRDAIKKILASQHQIPLYGCAAWSIDWRGAGQKVPTITKIWQPTELRTDGLSVSLLNSEKGSNFVIAEYVPEDIENRWTLCESTGDADEAQGAMRAILGSELRRFEQILEWQNINKKYKGLLQGTYDDAATQEEIDIAKAGAASAAKNNVVVTPASIAFKHNQMVSAGAPESFSNIILECRNEISVGILGQANTSELPSNGGSRAALQVLSKISADYHWSDINRVIEVINRLLLIDYRMNFDASALSCPWKFELYFPDTLDLEQRVDAGTRLYQSGIPVRRAELYKLLGMTPPDDAPEVLQSGAGGV